VKLALSCYHQTNLAIHILAGLALFGILRRTLLLTSVRQHVGAAATALALSIALLWLLHPLQTESVTYIVQRAESLAALWYLLVFYAVIRSAASRSILWPLAGVLACAAGMATKEIVATAPLLALLYDRTFLTGSFKESLRRRWAVYIALAACWGLLAYLGISGGSGHLNQYVHTSYASDAWSYGLTQLGIIPHYLRLSFWPAPLCLDYYGWPLAHRVAQVWPGAVMIALLLGLTAVGLLRAGKWGFLGAWFFVILSPTSSVIPVFIQVAAEHRMYLPLAAVATLVVLGIWLLAKWLLGRRARLHPISGSQKALSWAVPALAVIAAATLLGYLTSQRNHDYRSVLAIWQATVDARPTNARAENNLGSQLRREGKPELAMERYRRSVQLDPDFFMAHFDLGVILEEQGRLDPAADEFRTAIRLDGSLAVAYNNLGTVLLRQAKPALAAEQFRLMLQKDPNSPLGYSNLGSTLMKMGQNDQAAEAFRHAILLDPSWAKAYAGLEAALTASGRTEEAAKVHQQAVQPNLQR
jgi:Flp pilus assembly protein TadD